MTSEAKPIDLRSNLIEKRYRGLRRVPLCFFRIFPSSYHIFGDHSDCLRKKSLLYQNLPFGDLWWPQYWPDLKMTSVKFEISSRSILCHLPLVAKLRSFRDTTRGGNFWSPPRHNLNLLAPANNGVNLCLIWSLYIYCAFFIQSQAIWQMLGPQLLLVVIDASSDANKQTIDSLEMNYI